MQKARTFEAAVNIGHSGMDVLPKLELLAALADLDRAQFSGPVVDVLEEMAMDGAQVDQVERAARDAAATSQGHKASFLPVEKFLIGGTKPVS
jgi:hypothetical protein